MTTAKKMMHKGVECIPAHETLDRAAQLMREHQVGSLPICGADNKLQGIITDRDIVVKCVAVGKDPAKMKAQELATGTPVWVSSEASEDDVIKLMEDNLIRRLPVIDEKSHKLVGMISEADLARNISGEKMAQYCNTVYSAPASI